MKRHPATRPTPPGCLPMPPPYSSFVSGAGSRDPETAAALEVEARAWTAGQARQADSMGSTGSARGS